MYKISVQNKWIYALANEWESKLSGKFALELYDPGTNLKKVEHFVSEHLAWASGENWRMLTKGNSYKILEDGNYVVGQSQFQTKETLS